MAMCNTCCLKLSVPSDMPTYGAIFNLHISITIVSVSSDVGLSLMTSSCHLCITALFVCSPSEDWVRSRGVVRGVMSLFWFIVYFRVFLVPGSL